MKSRPCLKCQVEHAGKYPVCAVCIEGINTQWTMQAKEALRKLSREVA